MLAGLKHTVDKASIDRGSKFGASRIDSCGTCKTSETASTKNSNHFLSDHGDHDYSELVVFHGWQAKLHTQIDNRQYRSPQVHHSSDVRGTLGMGVTGAYPRIS